MRPKKTTEFKEFAFSQVRVSFQIVFADFCQDPSGVSPFTTECGPPSQGSAGRMKPGGARITNEPLGGTVSDGVSSMLTTPQTNQRNRCATYHFKHQKALQCFTSFHDLGQCVVGIHVIPCLPVCHPRPSRRALALLG